MENEINDFWNRTANSRGEEQRKMFLDFCHRLIQLKEEGKLSEEEATNKIASCIRFEDLSKFPECNDILDMAGDLEIPRINSYSQSIGKYDLKTADQEKLKSWKKFVLIVHSAKDS